MTANKFLDECFIRVQFSKLIKWIPYDFLKLNFSYFDFTTQVTLLFVEKGNLKFSYGREE